MLLMLTWVKPTVGVMVSSVEVKAGSYGKMRGGHTPVRDTVAGQTAPSLFGPAGVLGRNGVEDGVAEVGRTGCVADGWWSNRSNWRR